MEILFHEKFILLSLRVFHSFFLKNDFRITGLSYNDPGGDIIDYQSYDKKRMLSLVCTYQLTRENKMDMKSVKLDICFTRNRSFYKKEGFKLSEIFQKFPGYSHLSAETNDEDLEDKMKLYLKFINEHIIPVIQGEIRIDKLCSFK